MNAELRTELSSQAKDGSDFILQVKQTWIVNTKSNEMGIRNTSSKT